MGELQAHQGISLEMYSPTSQVSAEERVAPGKNIVKYLFLERGGGNQAETGDWGGNVSKVRRRNKRTVGAHGANSRKVELEFAMLHRVVEDITQKRC